MEGMQAQAARRERRRPRAGRCAAAHARLRAEFLARAYSLLSDRGRRRRRLPPFLDSRCSRHLTARSAFCVCLAPALQPVPIGVQVPPSLTRDHAARFIRV